MFNVAQGFTFANFLADVFTIFLFVLWLWLLITVTGDLFRQRDISGWGKAIWLIALILFSYLAIFIYLITQGRGMAERNAQQAKDARDELRRVVGFTLARVWQAPARRKPDLDAVVYACARAGFGDRPAGRASSFCRHTPRGSGNLINNIRERRR